MEVVPVLGQMQETINKHGMITRDDLIIVAVSGGPDSVAMLHSLHHLAPTYGAALHVFHLDHGLRGEDSAEDALYVRGLAARLGLPSTIVGLGPEVLKRQSGSLQANARRARYEEIEALAKRIGANKVAVGQNRNDQAETVLMRMLRGAGTRGLAGIPPVRTQENLTYIRPLIGIPRKEIEAYCLEHELIPRRDASNLKPDYLRNRIRLELLPQLSQQYNPAIIANLAQIASVLREEDDLLERLASESWAKCRLPAEGVVFSGGVLLTEPLALARRVVRMAAREAAGVEFELGLAAVSQVLEAAAKSEGTHQVDLPGGLRLTVEYGVCRLALGEQHSGLRPAEWHVSPVGSTHIPELGIQIEVVPPSTASPSGIATFDVERLPGPLAVRFRRPGDRIWPVGMEGSKKLQDILVDAKVPQRLRDKIPLLVSGDEVIWVIGFRLDRRFLAGASAEQVLSVKVTVDRANG